MILRVLTMKLLLCMLLGCLLQLQLSTAVFGDECYGLLKIRYDSPHQLHEFNGLVLNPEEDLVGSLNRAKVPFHEFFLKLTSICTDLCQVRGHGCIGYLSGSFIEADEMHNAETALQAVCPGYKKEQDDIMNGVKDPDCICIKSKDDTPELQQQYALMKATYTSDTAIFPILLSTVAFWEISIPPPDVWNGFSSKWNIRKNFAPAGANAYVVDNKKPWTEYPPMAS